MFKNVYLKRLIKTVVFKPLSFVNLFIKKRDDYIMLYSANYGIRHNLKPLLDRLISDGYNRKYKILCAVENKNYFEKINTKNVKYITAKKAILYYFISRHVYYTTGQIPIKPSKTQIVIQMDHGIPDLKCMGATTNIHNGDEFFFTYKIATSKLYIPIYVEEYRCSEKNIVICGEPMIDELYRKSDSYDICEHFKTILWLPTFRQSTELGYDDSSEELLPMFKQEEYDELNTVLQKLNIHLIVKLHSAQNSDGLVKRTFSNLIILDRKEFESKNYNLYKMITQVDALLGDYSSVSLQYLLLDKPVAYIIPDIEEYKKRRGFCVNNPEDYMAGPKIKTKNALYKFFEDVVSKNDEYSEERKRVRDILFEYQDGKNTDRVIKLGDIHI